ncbi:MAG: YihY/virulence factor BrkB family protein [Alphaproteobacteria bacterium]
MMSHFSRICRIAWNSYRRFTADESTICAGHVAFSTIMALFPFLIFATALAAFIGFAQRADEFVELTFSLLPEEVARTLGPTIKDILSTRRGSVLTVSMIGTAWAASSGIEALRAGLNRAYDVDQYRPFIRRRIQGLGLVIFAALMVFVITTVIVVGPLLWQLLINRLEVPKSWKWLWPIARFGLGVSLVFGASAFLYRWLPDRAPRWRHVYPGALVMTALWLGFASLFSVYLRNLGQYHAVYGSLAGIVITLLFFFLSAAVFIFGAQVNAAIRGESIERAAKGPRRDRNA